MMKKKQYTHFRLSCFLSFIPLFSALCMEDIKVPVFSDTLGNGLSYVIVPDTTVAVVSCRLYYFMGSMYENAGTTGLSHLYEHMMFKGTKILGTKNYEQEQKYIHRIDSLERLAVRRWEVVYSDTDSLYIELKKQIFALLEQQRTFIKKDEIWYFYQNNGATNLNAWTGDDLTAYIVTLPQNKVELFFWIESDRMRNIVLREFFSERDVVIEERHMRYENRPLGKYYEKLFELFYTAHPYRNPTIGWMSDLYTHTRVKLMDFVNKYYTPDNALIVLVGNISKEKGEKLLHTYFGGIPRAKTPKQEVTTRESAPIGQTRFTMHENAQPRIDLLFHTPGYPNDDLYNLDVVEGLLSGRSGRLYRRLVTQEKLCTDAGAQNVFRLHDSYFSIYATLKNDANPVDVERCIYEEIRKLTDKAPTENEMERIKNTIRMNFVSQLQSLEGLSDQLAWFDRLRNWKDLFEYPIKINQVIPESIRATVKKYLVQETQTIGQLLSPKEKASELSDRSR
ncbi:MAG: insulinase family protein [Chitinivibrionales bacterium]|nr:insulinase family protein [Chitinivibrionales bacterium]